MMGDFAEDCLKMGKDRCDCPTAIHERDRAERAERERGALRADNDRLREALSVMDEFVTAAYVGADEDWWEEYNTARAALSAGADADAEPSCGCDPVLPDGHEPGCTQRPANAESSCDCEPIRHGVGDEHQPDCAVRRDAEPERCGAQDPYGVAGPCHEPAGHSGWHCAGPIRYKQRVAEGGRPREADPQGDSPSTDASVDGGGDECDCDTAQYDGEHSRYCPAGDGGRSPAINAVFEATSLRLEQCVDAIDAALASGHVRLTDPGEPDISVEAYWAVSEERDRSEARVRELEAERDYWRGQCREAIDRASRAESAAAAAGHSVGSESTNEDAEEESETCACGHIRGLHSPIGGGCLPPESCTCTVFYDSAWSTAEGVSDDW